MSQPGTKPDDGGRGPDRPGRNVPDTPTELGGGSWLAAGKRSAKEFSNDLVQDRAAALTYYGVLAIFPGASGPGLPARPIWKTLPIRLGVTLAMMVLFLASVFIVVVTGGSRVMWGRCSAPAQSRSRCGA